MDHYLQVQFKQGITKPLQLAFKSKKAKKLASMLSWLYCFLQMVVVWQNLHQKVQLKCLGLKE